MVFPRPGPPDIQSNLEVFLLHSSNSAEVSTHLQVPFVQRPFQVFNDSRISKGSFSSPIDFLRARRQSDSKSSSCCPWLCVFMFPSTVNSGTLNSLAEKAYRSAQVHEKFDGQS